MPLLLGDLFKKKDEQTKNDEANSQFPHFVRKRLMALVHRYFPELENSSSSSPSSSSSSLYGKEVTSRSLDVNKHGVDVKELCTGSDATCKEIWPMTLLPAFT